MAEITTDVDLAAALLRAGGVVAFPTETVYGLGALASSRTAVARVFAIKARPVDHPLIVHLADASQLSRWGVPTAAATTLADACWPGPLTIVVRRVEHVLDAVTGGRDTVGLRVPSHPMALALIAAAGDALAAPSANRFGRVSPTTAAHVVADLGNDVDLVLDGGPCVVGIESTIVDATVEPPVILRHGAIAAEQIDEILGRAVERHARGPARAPGMHAAHYAPSCRLELVADIAEANDVLARERARGHRAELHDPGADLAGFARGLYGALRAADDARLDVLVVVTPPDTLLGAAINDRLRRAAHRDD